MVNLYRMASRSPNYVRAFGAIAGLRLLFAIERPLVESASTIDEYRVPGYAAPIALRRTVADHSVFWQCQVMRQYRIDQFQHHQRLMEQYRALNRRGRQPLIIDAGANIGMASLWFASAFPEAKIISIEPHPSNFALMSRNVRHLSDRVRPLRAALADRLGQLALTNPEAGSTAFRYAAGAAPEKPVDIVPAVTIDELCAQAPGTELFIAKIDIEGGQAALFASNLDWLDRVHMVVVELDDWVLPWQGTSRSFFRAMAPRPYEYLLSGESIFCFRDLGAQV